MPNQWRSDGACSASRKSGVVGRATLDVERAALTDLEVIWESEPYSHCNFTALETLSEERYGPWLEHLMAMSWDDPDHRRILELEGLTRWVPPQLEGYASLEAAMDEQHISDRW